ncbi:MAG: hypothetical protein OCD76_06175 [Reichenbachiella sp.]
MKKAALFTLCIILLNISYSYAQFRSGIYFGSVTTQLEGDRLSSFSEVKFGINHSYQYGVSIEYAIKDDVAIAFTPSYKQQGGTMYEENLEYDEKDEESEQWLASEEFIFHCISFPAYLRLISDNKHWQFSVGVIYDYIFIAEGKNISTGETFTPENVKKYNLSGSLNIGYRFNLFHQAFTIDLFYNQGVVNITDNFRNINDDFLPRLKLSSGETRFAWILPILNERKK